MNILIVRIGRMGDIVMILPALREIITKYPKANLYVITSKDGLRLLPLVGIPRDRIFVYRNGMIFRMIDNYKAKRFIAFKVFTHIFNFRSKKPHGNWLPKHAQFLSTSRQMTHYATRCLQMVSPEAIAQLFEHTKPYFIPKTYHQDYIKSLLKQLGIRETTIVIGFHPTYSGFNKWGRSREKIHRLWPSTYFASLAIQLMTEAKNKGLDLKIVMNVLPNERHFALQILEQSEGNIILLPDLPDFETYLTYLLRLNVLVVSNTGVMHLAAMLASPMVALFSNLHPDDCGPYMDAKYGRVLRAEDVLSSIEGLGAISPNQVLQQVLALVGDKPHVIP